MYTIKTDGTMHRTTRRGRFALLWPVNNAAFAMGLDPSTIRRAIYRGEIPAELRVWWRSIPGHRPRRFQRYLIPDEALYAWRNAKIRYWKREGKPGPHRGRGPSLVEDPPPR